MAFNEITGQALRDFDASRKIGMPAAPPKSIYGAPAPTPKPPGAGAPKYGVQDVGSSLRSTGLGAAFGAGVGSIVPGVGTAIGAGVGALGGYLADQWGNPTSPASWTPKDTNPVASTPAAAPLQWGQTNDTGKQLGSREIGAPSPTANPKSTIDALLADLIAERKADRAKMEGRIAQNTTLRDQTIGALDAYENPWQDPAKLAKQQRTDANEAFYAWNGTEDSIRREAMASGRGGAIGASALNARDNYRAAVDIASARREDDFTQRADAVNQWKIGMRGQLIGADLAGNQIGQLSGMANQGFQTASQGLLMPQQMDQTLAVIEGLKSQNRLTAAQAAQAEDVARNQGSYALINLLVNALGSAGKTIGMM